MIDLSQEYDVYVTSEVKKYAHGGISFWVDNWISNVAPYLKTKPVLIVEGHQTHEWMNFAKQYVSVLHRPGTSWEWEWTYRELPIPNYFSFPDRRTVDMVIKKCRKLHLLCYPIPLLHYGHDNKLNVQQMRDLYPKIDSIVIHSLEEKTLKVTQKTFEFNEQQLEYQQDSIDLQNKFIEDANNTIWIGVNNTKLDFNIPNYYEFKHNLPACESNVVGFPSRSEARKNLNYLENIPSIAFTKPDNIEYWTRKLGITFSNLQVVEYIRDEVNNFYSRSDWGISHSCFENEPFGYSIFQSIDYGKLPILSNDWCGDMKYPFRASTKKQFEIEVSNISKLSVDERNIYLGQLKEYLSEYSNLNKWRGDLLNIYNKDGNEVWLPTSIKPSND
tara:strand:+ start:1458 stop:2618 length:1161 start_codon:yes stop_codon:yes gene_type:complete